MGIAFPRVGGSFTLEELESKARELHEAGQPQSATEQPAPEAADGSPSKIKGAPHRER